ncbi:MAG: FtsX-like permease family protein [Candidatus Cyclobacteriaceae bacterium M3_2C_046]
MSAKKIQPPKSATSFLTWFLRDDLAEEVQGDLEEQFYANLQTTSLLRARLNYWFQVINYLRPFALSKYSPTLLINQGMFRSYFKISIRNLYKQKLYAMINIGGLAVGLTCFLLIFLFVQHELTYNRDFSNWNSVYRIIYKYQPGEVHLNSDMEYAAITPAPLAPTLVEEFPEVVIATSVDEQTALIGLEENNLYLDKGLIADAHFFEIFDFPFIYGNTQTALDKPNTIVLTQSLADKIFGHKKPLGQAVIYQNGNYYGTNEAMPIKDAYIVTGVIQDPPENISFQFSYIASISSDSFYAEEINSWGTRFLHTFLLLAEETDHLALQAKLPTVLNKYYDESHKYIVQSMADMHLQSYNVANDLGPKINPKYVYLFSAIALIVLLLASGNYINLAIARSAGRAREVGLRKAVGAVRQQLILQFLGESVLLTFIALLLALGLTYLVLPVFSDLVDRSIALNFMDNSWLLPGLPTLVFIVGILSGSYPALYMSSLRPFQVLKGKIENRTSGFNLQKFLIVFQYAVSVVLIIGSIVIYRQLQFIQTKELGYDKEHVITVTVRDNSVRKNFEVIRNDLLQNRQIIAITKSESLPTDTRGSSTIDFDGDSKHDSVLYRNLVHYDFLQVFDLQLVAGRNFSQEIQMGEAYIINEAAAKAWGWTPEEAIGQKPFGRATVIGVVKDFHMQSMYSPIQPLNLILHNARDKYISLKVGPENISETVEWVEKTFKKYSSYPFEYSFLDDRYDQLYKSEIKLGMIFGFFTIIAILLASLGIFGMAAFSTTQRTKEIGIRKVMGASLHNIMLLLSRDFLILVIMAFFIALPFAWYAVHQWLQDFAYRINLEWWMFTLAGLLVFFLAYVAIGYQSARAALINPVDSLRSE